MKAVVFTLGCKVNRYESDLLAQELKKRGYEVSEETEKADIYILNTCAVTQEAERKSRQCVARCLKYNPGARVFVLGCASQKEPTAFKKDGVVYVGGTSAKNAVLDELDRTSFLSDVAALPLTYEDGCLAQPSRTRAYIKIQDGCNNFCSYCIIPYLRGRSRSRSVESIVKEAELLATSTPELVLTGINTMAFGKDTGESTVQLLHALKDLNVRIRLGSVYAENIDRETLDALFGLKKFCPHFHLSLQSGDGEVLRAMNRRYTPEVYRDKIDMIRSFDKNASVTTDLIIGYPTETEENFMNSYRFAKEVAFSDLHLFPFSSRKGTKAAALPVLPSDVMNDRKERMTALKKTLRHNYTEKNIGIPQEVLIEEKTGDRYCGYSRNYIKIYTDKSEGIASVVPTKTYKDGLSE